MADTLTVELLQGATVAATWVVSPTSTLTTYTHDLDAADLANITDWSTLRLSLSASGTQASVTWAALSAPDAGQFARPEADVSTGFWSASTGGDLFEMVNEPESLLDDTDYIYSDATPIKDTVEFALTSVDQPISGDVTIRVRGKLS